MNHWMKTKKTTVIVRLRVTSACADIVCKYVNAGEGSRGEDEKATVGPGRATLTVEFSRTDRGFPCRN